MKATQRSQGIGVPMLMYHEVGPRATIKERYTVASEDFRDQLAYLRDSGFEAISIDRYYSELAAMNGEGLKKKVVVTFDDNNICHYTTSLPMLREFGFSATFFLVSSHIDTMPDMVTAAQIVEMKRAGMQIESHSHTHRFLATLADQDLRDELVISKQMLEDCVQSPVKYISCPGGSYNDKVSTGALAAGYSAVCTSIPGFNAGSDAGGRAVLKRFLVSADTRMARFSGIVEGNQRLVSGEIFKHRMKSTIKGLLGIGLYHKAWQQLRRDV